MNDCFLVRHDVSLLPYNTFGIDVKARRLAVLRPAGEGSVYAPAVESLVASGLLDGQYLILGGGSNMVFTRDYDGTVVMMSPGTVRQTMEDGDSVLVEADAGMKMDDLVAWTIEKGLYGLENLSAIPGTVGASVVQNIGAYGAEAKDFVESVNVFDLCDRKYISLDNADCRFGYRNSMFKQQSGRYLVLSVVYRLSPVFVPNLRYKALEGLPNTSAAELREAIVSLRWSKLPRPEENGSAGSFFKNPVVDDATYRRLVEQYPDMPVYPGNKLSAGWLIDRCGWKGRQMGRVGVWPRQALVLYNVGGCSGAEVRQLADAIAADVNTRFGVPLDCEAIFV